MTHQSGETEDLGERIHAAIKSVKKEVRGMPQEQAEERLVAALRRQDVFLPDATVRQFARHVSDPWWPARHPLKAMRLLRREDTQPDLEARRYEAEADALLERIYQSGVHEQLDSFDLRSTRSFEGMMHEIRIDPWSSEMAARIRDVAAPAQVTVKPRI